MRRRINCHMTRSVDGRLLVDRWTAIEAGLVHRLYDETAARLPSDQ